MLLTYVTRLLQTCGFFSFQNWQEPKTHKFIPKFFFSFLLIFPLRVSCWKTNECKGFEMKHVWQDTDGPGRRLQGMRANGLAKRMSPKWPERTINWSIEAESSPSWPIMHAGQHMHAALHEDSCILLECCLYAILSQASFHCQSPSQGKDGSTRHTAFGNQTKNIK